MSRNPKLSAAIRSRMAAMSAEEREEHRRKSLDPGRRRFPNGGNGRRSR